jgi:hypothetical protein
MPLAYLHITPAIPPLSFLCLETAYYPNLSHNSDYPLYIILLLDYLAAIYIFFLTPGGAGRHGRFSNAKSVSETCCMVNGE